MPQLKILSAATKTQSSQINKYIKINIFLKRECNSNTGYKMEEPRGHCAKGKKADTAGHMLRDPTLMR